MSKFEDRFNKRRLRTSYITTVISITLVLFMLGMLGLILINARSLSDYVKENIKISVILNDSIPEPEIIQLQKSIEASNYVKNTEFITKQEAAKIVEKDLGENFIAVLGFNPLSESIDIRLKAEYANNDSIKKIEKQLMKNPQVKEVSYQPSLIDKVNSNVNKISLFLFGFSLILFVIAFALINNTIRLAVYSKRLIIKSMQLVGATRGFIRRPFIFTGLIQGVISAILSIALLSLTLKFANGYFPDFISSSNIKTYGIVYLAITIIGLLMSWISTYFAVRKYLKIRTTEIF